MPPTMPDDSTAEFSASRRSIPGFCGLCRSRCGSRMVVEDGAHVSLDVPAALTAAMKALW